MGQDFRLLAPVRGLTRPPIPHPFHGLWQNCPETFLHEDIDFFSFSVVMPAKQTKLATGTVGEGAAGKKAKATQHPGGQSVSEKSQTT